MAGNSCKDSVSTLVPKAWSKTFNKAFSEICSLMSLDLTIFQHGKGERKEGVGKGRESQGGRREKEYKISQFCECWLNCRPCHLPKFVSRYLRSMSQVGRSTILNKHKQMYMSTQSLIMWLALLRTKYHFSEKPKHECNSVFNPTCLSPLPCLCTKQTELQKCSTYQIFPQKRQFAGILTSSTFFFFLTFRQIEFERGSDSESRLPHTTVRGNNWSKMKW